MEADTTQAPIVSSIATAIPQSVVSPSGLKPEHLQKELVRGLIMEVNICGQTLRNMNVLIYRGQNLGILLLHKFIVDHGIRLWRREFYRRRRSWQGDLAGLLIVDVRGVHI